MLFFLLNIMQFDPEIQVASKDIEVKEKTSLVGEV